MKKQCFKPNVIKYSENEINFILSKYQNHTAEEISDLTNKKFWKNKIVRTTKAIRKKLENLKIKKTETEIKTVDQPIEQPASITELQTVINTLEKDLTKKNTINDVITDIVKNSIRKLPIVKVPEIIVKKGMHKPETAFLELGDIHIGEKIEKSEVANITEYNFDIFKKRLDTLRDNVIECIDIQRSKIPIDTLDINILGDCVTGEDIYLGQLRNISIPIIDQVFAGGDELIGRLLLPLCSYFNKVRIRAVYGNHGRPSKPNQFHQRTNFDLILYKILEKALENQKNLEMYISDCPIMLYKIPEAPKFTHLISHGHEIAAGASVPYYGIQRDHAKYVQMFSQPIHYWHFGHFHTTAKIDIPYGEQILNGTFCGGSELSVYKMKTKSQPKQLLFGFNNNRGITWRYDIQLDSHKDLVADINSIYTPLFKK